MKDAQIHGRPRPASSPKPATIYDVARAAGVSHQTVSRYLTGFAGIRPQTRARVEAALQALNYRPNMAARSLKASKSHRIGALAYELREVGPSRILRTASEAARDAGYVLDLVSLDPSNPDDFDDAIRLLNQNDFAGILAGAPTDQLLQVLDSAPFTVPMVLEREPDAVVAGADAPSARGTMMLTEHLISLGHRRIVHLNGPLDWIAARNRVWGYRRSMRAAGFVPQEIDGAGWSAAHGHRALRDGLAPDVTAIVAANDLLALGALRMLHSAGIAVPEQVSVVGFDDIPEAAYLIPPLTTLHQDYDALGQTAVYALLELIGAREPGSGHPTSDISLVVRESSGPPPR